MENAIKAENLQAISEKVTQTAEEFKAQSEAMIREGGRLLKKAEKELKAEFDRHPVAMIIAGAAVAGALVWFLTKK